MKIHGIQKLLGNLGSRRATRSSNIGRKPNIQESSLRHRISGWPLAVSQRQLPTATRLRQVVAMLGVAHHTGTRMLEN